MKIKKLFIILLISIFTIFISCKNNDEPVVIPEPTIDPEPVVDPEPIEPDPIIDPTPKPIEIILKKYKDLIHVGEDFLLEFGINLDDYDLSDFVISYDDNIIIIDDYIVKGIKAGSTLITIASKKNKDISISFTLDVEEKPVEKIALDIDYTKYLDKTTKNIDFNSYSNEIKSVLYGVARAKDTIIAYDENKFVKTNIYGWEIAIDKYGTIVESNVNVTLPSGGVVISAHGVKTKLLKEISVGDIAIFYNSSLFVYESSISKYNSIFLKLKEIIDSLDKIESNKAYNIIVTKLNQIKTNLDNLYLNYNEQDALIINECLNSIIINEEYEEIHNHTYNYVDLKLQEYTKTIDFNTRLYYTSFDYKVFNGGFRAKDTIVKYDASNFRERNIYGYEVAIDKNGKVIDKKTLVELPIDGYILSGSGIGLDFIQESINIGDRIILKDIGFDVYRDDLTSNLQATKIKRNTLLDKTYEDINKLIPHDYKYIEECFIKADKLLDIVYSSNATLFDVVNNTKLISEINNILNTIRFQLLDNALTKEKALWYRPFTNYYDDTSYDGVVEMIKDLKRAGITKLIVDPFYSKKALFKSTDFVTYEKLEEYDYKEYGHDFFKCLITEAHKENIAIGIIDGTFSEKIDGMKEPNYDLYQIDYSGEKSKGSIYYYDIASDIVKELKYQMYRDLLSQYDIDNFEFDIIRYPETTLYKATTEVIDKQSIIDPGWSSVSVSKFMNKYNLTGDLHDLVASSSEIRALWLKFKEDELISFIINASNIIRDIKPDILISAAVLSDYENTKLRFLQDWVRWLDEGLIDAVEVMNYLDDTEKFKIKLEKNNTYASSTIITSGISTNIFYSTIEEIDMAYNNKGFILFSSTSYLNDKVLVNQLSSNHHYDFVSSLSLQDDINNAIMNDIKDMINNFYTKASNINFSNVLFALGKKDINELKTSIRILNNQYVKEYLTEKIEALK